jgi:N-acetyl-gamma-glutamylphosphate reductase
MTKVGVSGTGSVRLYQILESHPGVELRSFDQGGAGRLEFGSNGKTRTVSERECTEIRPFGLVELMDNNPLVCAEASACTSAAGTLALIATGPLIRAGILKRASLQFNFPATTSAVQCGLATEGWHGEVEVGDARGPGDVFLLDCLADVSEGSEVEAIYDECFARTFFVQRQSGSIEPDAVANTPNAHYVLRASDNEANGACLRVQVAASPEGKCGAAHLVHMFNVMCCFEEDLGLT